MIAYKPLGRTGLRVSEMSIGGSTIGNVYGNVETDRAIEAVRRGIDGGLNLVDTSPFYGKTLSESRLGDALEDGYRDKVVLATKAGRHGGHAERGFDYTYDGILRSWQESAERLRTDYFDVYQLHDVEFVPETQIVAEAWPAMVRLKERGQVGHIGITGYPVRYLARLARTLDPTPETVLTYCHYNLLNTMFDDWLLPTVEELGIGVINASITHMGILTRHGPPDWHPAPPEVLTVGRTVCDLVASKGSSVTDVALQFALAHPHISTTCVGMSSVEEVEQNLRAADQELDRELLAGIEELAGPIRRLSWEQGLPATHDPGSIPGRHAWP